MNAVVIAGVIAMLISAAAGYLITRKSTLIKSLGITIFLLMGLLLLCACYGIRTMDKVVTEISGTTKKTSTIVVAVQTDDPAISIQDIADYRIGIQAIAHKQETNETIKKIRQETNSDCELVSYNTIQEEANALLSGEIQAAVYSDGFTPVLTESIDDWEKQIRILLTEKVETKTVTDECDITKPFCVYLSGIDTEGPVNSTGRSDVNIIAAVNPKTHHILLVSTPRDYYVKIPGISGEQRDKLTHAGIYGPEVSIQTLEQIYDITIPYYAKLNFTSLVHIIDTLGGIDVAVEQSFTVGDFVFTEGIQHMDGIQALIYCRERKSFEEGDFQRGKNQEAVLTAIINKCLSPDILMHMNELVAEFSNSVETSMSGEDITKLINLQLTNLAPWEVASVSATGTTDNQPCYSYGSTLLSVVWPDENNIENLKTQIKEHQQ